MNDTSYMDVSKWSMQVGFSLGISGLKRFYLVPQTSPSLPVLTGLVWFKLLEIGGGTTGWCGLVRRYVWFGTGVCGFDLVACPASMESAPASMESACDTCRHAQISEHGLCVREADAEK